MKKLTAEQIQDNWKKLIDTIEGFISDDRKENLLKMYDDFKDRMMFVFVLLLVFSSYLIPIFCKFYCWF